MRRGADVDFWLWEADGRKWVPWYGTRTPNGLFTGDSWDSDPHAYYEGWISNRVVEMGQYHVFAHLWENPDGGSTTVDVRYRFNPSATFTSIYQSSPSGYPVLNSTTRIEDHPGATFSDARAGMYSNFKHVAVWTLGARQSPSSLMPGGAAFSGALVESLPTPADFAELQRLMRERPAESVAGPKAGAPAWLGSPPPPLH